MEKHLHTFVVLAFKESKHLEDCIKSVLYQKHKSYVVIATSTPNNFIKNIARSYGLDILINENNKKGIGYDFEFASKFEHSELVTVAHQDDIYNYDYSYKMIERYKKNKSSIILFSDYYEIRGNENISTNINLIIKRIILMPLRFNVLNNSKFIKRSCLFLGNAICCPAVTFVSEKIMHKELFICDFKCNIDWYAWEKLSLEKGSFEYLSDKLMGHRVHENSTTTAIIKDNVRTQEDLVMFEKFWPCFIAKRINVFYKKSENSN